MFFGGGIRRLLRSKKRPFKKSFFIVAGLGVEPSLRDYEPRVHRTLSRAVSEYCSKVNSKDQILCLS